MPKIIDYPRASLSRALALAEAVDKLGGEASDASVADHMGNKVGGAFNALVGAAVKFGLVSKTSVESRRSRCTRITSWLTPMSKSRKQSENSFFPLPSSLSWLSGSTVRAFPVTSKS